MSALHLEIQAGKSPYSKNKQQKTKEAVSKERSINREGLKALNPKIAKNSDTAIYLCVLRPPKLNEGGLC